MKYLSEFRNAYAARRIADDIHRICRNHWRIMEVCGGQTHSIIRNGIDQILPSRIELIHGPGCPVCVTPVDVIDKALGIAGTTGVIFCTFGYMLRVPGTSSDLFDVRCRGGDIRIVYSPIDAVETARANPDRQVVFFGVGFETTAPANALAIDMAKRQGISNFSMLISHVLVPPAIESILRSKSNRVQAFLAAGHVCSVMGFKQYPPIASKYGVPIVVTGFEPLDILEGIRRAVRQLEDGVARVENAYERAVTFDGNLPAQALLAKVFETTDRNWRGLGVIPGSGWRLTEEYRDFDADYRFQFEASPSQESTICRAGEVLIGAIKPNQCEAFGKRCTPRTPLGATMVSHEGACAAYYDYGRLYES